MYSVLLSDCITSVIMAIRHHLDFPEISLRHCEAFAKFWYAGGPKVWRKDEVTDTQRNIGALCGRMLAYPKKNNHRLWRNFVKYRKCAQCYRWKESKRRRFRRCERCKDVLYCCRKHQKVHWNNAHNYQCKPASIEKKRK